LSNIAKAKLDEVALRLRQDPSATVEIRGHADSSGDVAANEALSLQRAEAARDYLVSRHGIDAGRIRALGRGAAEPTGDDASAAGRRENRRAEIVVRIGG
jgi:outer membrane protein OmpA-like peptidoglycan-associated protein